MGEVTEDMLRSLRSEINHNLTGGVTLCGEGGKVGVMWAHFGANNSHILAA